MCVSTRMKRGPDGLAPPRGKPPFPRLPVFIAPFLALRESNQYSCFTYFDGNGIDATCAFRVPQGEILSVKTSAQSRRAQHAIFRCVRAFADYAVHLCTGVVRSHAADTLYVMHTSHVTRSYHVCGM